MLESMLEKPLIMRRTVVVWGAIFAVLSAFSLSAFSGCGPGRPVWERTQPISGTITYKGKPIGDAELNFFPEEKEFPETVRPKAKSTVDGKFTVWTYQQGDGAPVGSYKVTVIHNEVTVSKGTIVAKPNDLPPKYARLDSTDIILRIEPGQKELPPIDLK